MSHKNRHPKHSDERTGRDWQNRDQRRYGNINDNNYGRGGWPYQNEGERENVGASRDSTRNMYGGDTSNYGNMNQGGFDRSWSRIPEMISSWFGSNKGKGPKGYRRSEERIMEEVCERLTDSPDLDASEIEVKVDDSEVILTGTVESRADKRRAEDIADSVFGVRDVHNQLRIADPSSRSDEKSSSKS